MATWENKYTELSNVNNGNKIEDSDVIIAEHANVALQNTAHLKTLLNNSVIRDVTIDSANKRMVLTIATKGNNDSSATISTVYINANNVGAVSLDVADYVSGTTRSYIYNFGSSFLISSIDTNNSSKKNTLNISKNSATLTTGDGTNTKIIDLTQTLEYFSLNGTIRYKSNEQIVSGASIFCTCLLKYILDSSDVGYSIPDGAYIQANGYITIGDDFLIVSIRKYQNGLFFVTYDTTYNRFEEKYVMRMNEATFTLLN